MITCRVLHRTSGYTKIANCFSKTIRAAHIERPATSNPGLKSNVFGRRLYHSTNASSATSTGNTINLSLSTGYVASKVSIPVDAKPQDFSALLLRDLCQCPLCVHESTKQKLFSTADIPSEIQAKKVSTGGLKRNTVNILWDCDVPGFDSEHSTELSIDVLREITKSGDPSGPPLDFTDSQVLWDAKTCVLTDFDHEAYMHDDRTLFHALQQLHKFGLVFIKNVPGVEKSVSTIAERIGPVKDTLYGHTWDVRTVPAAINAAYTSQDLGFHTDLLYTQNPPHVQLLHCIQSSSVGGASVFADAYKTAIDLFDVDPNAFDILAELPINYHYNHPGSHIYLATKPVLDLRPLRVGRTVHSSMTEYLDAWKKEGHQLNEATDARSISLAITKKLDKINWGPPFLAPFSLKDDTIQQAGRDKISNGSLNQKIDQWHAAASKFNTLLNRTEMLYERLMQPGECVLFDNTRVLHSRKAFDSSDHGKARWLRGTYVDKDPYLSKVRVLKHQLEYGSLL